MDIFRNQFGRHVQHRADCIAITNAQQSISYGELAKEIETICEIFSANQVKRLAIAMSNSPAYICVDLATLFQNIISIAIPAFFSKEQIVHLLDNADADTVIIDDEVIPSNEFYNKPIESSHKICIFGKDYWLIKLKSVSQQKPLPVDTIKISYTSGTTGHPKGVIICGAQVDKVVDSLSSRLNACIQDRHISVLPYALLLENIAGVYTVLAAGGQCIVPTLAELGYSRSSSVDINKFINTVHGFKPTTMITVPALAQAFVTGTEQFGIAHESFRFIAVGGAPLSVSILKKAQILGLPLHEGYGLTESCSVVSLNTDTENKIGSVGKPLDHIDVVISEEGEILVSGSLCAGYINNRELQQVSHWATGDIGYLDEDGFLYVTGRKRTSFSTAYGRNVSPEWVESELNSQPKIHQTVIYGEGKTFNIAIVVTCDSITEEELQSAITQTNEQLPDYAQISRWLKADEPYSVTNGQLSMSGIIQRDQIINHYQHKINSIYQ